MQDKFKNKTMEENLGKLDRRMEQSYGKLRICYEAPSNPNNPEVAREETEFYASYLERWFRAEDPERSIYVIDINYFRDSSNDIKLEEPYQQTDYYHQSPKPLVIIKAPTAKDIVLIAANLEASHQNPYALSVLVKNTQLLMVGGNLSLGDVQQETEKQGAGNISDLAKALGAHMDMKINLGKSPSQH